MKTRLIGQQKVIITYMFVQLNYILDVQISYYKLEEGKLVDNWIRFVYLFF